MSGGTVSLSLSESSFTQGLQYQILSIELTANDRQIKPQDINNLELPPGVDTNGGVVINGRAPIWFYSFLTRELHPTAWIACYDPRLGAVVTATNSQQVSIGQVIPMTLGNGGQQAINLENRLCPALMIVGPPDSGKSILSYSLFQALLPNHPDIYLQRAHWDGEGNYTLELGETATDEDIEGYKLRNKGALTEQFFPDHAKAILQLRKQKSLVIVDVGGMVQPEKLPILEACTHYLIISSQRSEVDAWHEFCRDRGNLKPVAVIHSTLANVDQVHKTKPYLEMISGPWVRDKKKLIPKDLLNYIKSIFIST